MLTASAKMNPVKKTYACIIIDDNELDRLTVVSYVNNYPFLQISGAFESAEAALAFTHEKGLPDVIFLDIDMPGMNGLAVRKELQAVPACIFVTSHPEFALEGFEMAALDYIVKPLHADRFAVTMERLKAYLELYHNASTPEHKLENDTLFIKDGFTHVQLQVQDIVYLEALKDYTGIITRQKKYCVLSPLGNLLKEKAFSGFVRIHRSYAVHKQSIQKITLREVSINGKILPVGRSYKETVEKLVAGH
jgi:two-component system, LytTR family, response regulator